jgi:MFS family permease
MFAFTDKKRFILYSICLFLFIDSVGAGLIFPILPALFTDEQYGLLVQDCYFSKGTLYGLSFAIFPMASMLGMPILGYMADKYGKPLVIVYGIFGFIITDILCILSIVAGSIWLFLFGRLLMGFLSGTYAAGMAMISDISDNDSDRISNFKLCTFASVVGVLLGPGFAFFIDGTSCINPFIMPFIVVMILSICSFTVLWVSFRKMGYSFSLPKYVTTACCQDNIKKVRRKHFSVFMVSSILFSVLTNSNRRFLFISFLSIQFGFSLYNQSLSLFLVTTFMYTPKNLSVLLIMISLVSILSMYVLQPIIKKFYEYQSQIKISLIIVIILFIIYSYYILTSADGNVEFYKKISLFTVLILEFSMPFITLGFTNLFANSVNKLEQGRIMGSYGQISSIATIISGIIVGKLIFTSYFLIILSSTIALILGYMALKKYLISDPVSIT